MTNSIQGLCDALESCFLAQSALTAAWHETEPERLPDPGPYSLERLCDFVLVEHLYNFKLWHVEDIARRRDVPDSVIADCKRRVDALNQLRNDSMEQVDQCLYAILLPLIPNNGQERQNTETAGMALDRLSILSLKIFHMEEQSRRADAGPEHTRACLDKLQTLIRQRETLCRAVLELIADYASGTKTPALFFQCKMYNDPSLNPQLHG